MATEKTLNTRILLKYDTYANWTTNNPVLKKGEVAIATIENNQDGVQNAPSILMKVGDGESNYNTLKFVSGLAADVHSWAKAATKPTYKADEIDGLADYIAGEIEDTDTQYQIVKVDDYNYKLQSKALGGDWADVANGAIVIPKYDDTEVKADIEALEGLVGTTAVATQIANAIDALDLANTYEAKGTAATEAGKVQTALNEYKTANDAAVKANADAITAIKDGTTIDSFADVESALIGKQAAGDYATKAQAQAYANAKDAAITAAQEAADKAQGEVDALETVVDGKADKATTLAGYGITDAYTKEEVDAAIEDAEYDDTALAARVSANETAISTLNGTGDGSVSKTVNDAINDFATKISDDGTVNTFKEMIDYAAEHNSDFTAALGDIEKNKSDIATLNGDATTAGSVAKTVADAIAEQNLGQYATDTDLAAAVTRIATLEGEMDTAQADIDAVETEVAKKANTADLAAVATTGNVNDLVQTSGDVLIFDCGNSVI